MRERGCGGGKRVVFFGTSFAFDHPNKRRTDDTLPVKNREVVKKFLAMDKLLEHCYLIVKKLWPKIQSLSLDWSLYKDHSWIPVWIPVNRNPVMVSQIRAHLGFKVHEMYHNFLTIRSLIKSTI